MNAGTESKSERIDIRVTPSAKRILQEAAAVKSKTVTEFVLDVALAQAAEALAEQRVFSLDQPRWEEFLAVLDAPTKPKPRLSSLLREPGALG